MRGVLHVLDEDEPLPAASPFGPTREFVRMWTLDDLAADAKALSGRSFEQGRRAVSDRRMCSMSQSWRAGSRTWVRN